MKRNETAQSLLLHFNCHYSHIVKANYDTALSCHFYRNFEIYKDLSYPFILKGNLKKKGAKFMLRRPDLGVIMFYEILDSLVTDYYSRFKYQIYKTIPETFKYIHLVEIRYIDEDECDIRSSLIYDNKIILSEKEFQNVIRFKINLYKSIELSLRKLTLLKISIVYTIINCKIELIWNILINMKMIHKYSHLLGDEIKYNGNIIKKNYFIELINNMNKLKNKSIAVVNKCKLIKMEFTKEGLIELLFQKKDDNNSPFAESKIILRIYEYKEKCSMYIIFYFENIQNTYDLDDFTIKKNKQLKKFKDIVENYNENNLKNIFF